MAKIIIALILLFVLSISFVIYSSKENSLVGITPTSSLVPARTDVEFMSDASWQNLPTQVILDTVFRQYATVYRKDSAYRQMYINEAVLQNWGDKAKLPPNTFIVMETYYSAGVESTNFTKALEAAGFTYGSFSPNLPSFSTGAEASCTECHQLSADPNGTFTLPLIQAAVTNGQVMTTFCNQTGRTPCEPSVYLSMTPVPAS